MVPELGPQFPFSVDTWSLASQKKKYHFLTHAHKDHTLGIDCHGCFPIYCSAITAKLVLRRHRKLSESILVELELEEPTLFEHAGQSFTVTAYDANHCPGSIMLLFEGQFGNILHTGDCRLSKDCYSRLPFKWFSSSLDCIYLDCTFGKEEVKMPARDDAIKQVKQCIWNHPDTPVIYLACDLLGHEILLRCISATFGEKIYVDRIELPEFFVTMLVVAPELLTEDPSSTRFHVCEGFPKLYEKAKLKFKEANMKGLPEPLFIRPSAQWYTYGERLEGVGSGLILHETIYPKTSTIRRRRARSIPSDAERDEFGVWHVCFSMHSSREELEMALRKLRPKQIVSIVPHCKPSDLGYENVIEVFARSQLHTATWKGGEAETLRSISQSRTEIVVEKVQMEDTANGSAIFVCSPKKTVPLFGRVRDGLPPPPPLFFDCEEADPVVKDLISAEKDVPIERMEGNKEMPVKVGDEDEIEGSGVFGWWKSSTSTSTISRDNKSTEKGNTELGPDEEDENNESCVFGWWKSHTGTSTISSSSFDKSSLTRCDREKGVFEESTRIICRSLHMTIPSRLPSLVEMARQLHTRKRCKSTHT